MAVNMIQTLNINSLIQLNVVVAKKNVNIQKIWFIKTKTFVLWNVLTNIFMEVWNEKCQ